MKVLFVINSLGAGGSERSLAEMLPGLARLGVHPTVACLKGVSEGVAEEVVARGFDVRFVRGGALPEWVLELRRIIRAEQPDVLHTVLFEADMAGRLAAVGTDATVVTSLVNTTYDPARLADPRVTRTKLRVVRLVDAWTARHLTHHFHAVTEAVKRSSVAHLGIEPERITVIERGRDARRLGAGSPQRRRRVRDRLGLSEADEVVLNVGRQEFQKGQRHLVEAIGRLRNRPRLLLLLAGRRGHLSEELVEAAEDSGVTDRVRFLGHRDDVPDLLAAADLFAFPSIYEGLGGAVIEALALGLPVVASDLPALREVLERNRNAVLVKPGNPDELASAIAQLLDDPERARAFGARSRELFEQRFDLDRSVSRSVDLYRRVVGERRAAPATGPRSA